MDLVPFSNSLFIYYESQGSVRKPQDKLSDSQVHASKSQDRLCKSQGNLPESQDGHYKKPLHIRTGAASLISSTEVY